eukprot:TRINITY_DN30801_c0_g1_i1.p1 TRINITY_DN30801_c0_g1~~TRINITY_DN30801_c0_g1_i1.p1  ORF type:complete len:783 (+),score=85.43 TRINITY_DN30801_c0_g1_i1:139-2487(+)
MQLMDDLSFDEDDNSWSSGHSQSWTKAAPTAEFFPDGRQYHFDTAGMTGDDIDQFTKYFRQVGGSMLKTMKSLPEEVVSRLKLTAVELLKLRLRIRMLLKVSRIRRSHLTKNMEKPPLRILSHSPVFKLWPLSALEGLHSSLVPHVYDSGEFVFHEGEPTTSGAIIITSGIAEELQLNPKTSSRRTKINVINTFSGQDEHIFCDIDQITSETHMRSVVARTICEAWVIESCKVREIYNKLDSDLKEHVLEVALSSKLEELTKRAPVTTSVLRCSSPLFATATDSELREIISKLTPKVVRKGQAICAAGSTATCAYIAYKGRVTLMSKTTSGKEQTTTMTPTSSKVILISEFEMLLKEKRRTTAIATQHTFLCEIELTDFTSAPSLLTKATNFASEHRKKAMDRSHIETSLSHCPVFVSFDASFRKQAATLFTPHVIPAGGLIASCSQKLDSMILVSRGIVRVKNIDTLKYPGEDTVYPGECVGYTGLLQQRWTHPIFAITMVECWVLPYSVFIPWLRERRILNRMRDLSVELYQKQEAKRPKGESLLVDAVDTFIAPRPQLLPGSKWSQVTSVMNDVNNQMKSLLSPDTKIELGVAQKGVGLWRKEPLSQRQCVQLPTQGSSKCLTPARSFMTAPPSKSEVETNRRRSFLMKTCKISMKMNSLHAKAQSAIGIRMERIYRQMNSTKQSLRDQCNQETNTSSARCIGYVEGTRRLLPDTEVQRLLKKRKRRRIQRLSSAPVARPVPPPLPPAEISRRPHSAGVSCLFKVRASQWSSFRTWLGE